MNKTKSRKEKVPTPSPQSSDESERSDESESEYSSLLTEWGTKDKIGVGYEKFSRKYPMYHPDIWMKTHSLCLEIHEDVLWFFDKVWLTKFISLKSGIYEDSTVEFLATAKNLFLGEYARINCPSSGVLNFQHGQIDYSISIKDICTVFGFEDHGAFAFPYQKEFLQAWRRIGNPNYNCSQGKINSSSIRHPGLRYAHKLLAYTLFHRQEATKVNVEEYFLLLKPFTNNKIEVNLGSVLVCLLVNFRHWLYSTPLTNPATSIGNLITPILQACGIYLQGLPPLILGDKRLDLSFLTEARFIRGVLKESERFKYQLDQQKVFLLPSKDLPSIQSKNPNFEPSLDQLYQSADKNSMENISKWQKRKKSEATPSANHATPSEEKRMYEALVVKEQERSVQLVKENAMLKKRMCKLISLTRELLPKRFRKSSSRTRTSNHDGNDESIGTHDEVIQEFIDDYIEVGEQAEQEPILMKLVPADCLNKNQERKGSNSRYK